MIKQEDVTIIIPHLGKTEEQRYAINQCLPSLLETSSCKVIVAINGGVKPYLIEGLTEERVSLIALSEQGQCKAVNAAAATVNTPWILITNDDMIFGPNWFEKLTKPVLPLPTHLVEDQAFKEDDFKPFGTISMDGVVETIMPFICISPKLVEPNKAHAPTFVYFFAGGAGGDFKKEKFLEFEKQWVEEGVSSGFNFPLLIRKDLWDLVGGYDVDYDPWGSNSDSDLEYKIKLAGVQPVQNQACLVYHFSQTSGTFEPDNQSFWHKNWIYFIEKWGFPRTDQGIWEATFEIPDKERKYRPHWEGFYK